MRTTLTLLLGACASIADAQLVNGSFEEGLQGWTFLYGASVLTDAAPGQGSYSLAIQSSTTVNVVRQVVTGLEEDMVVHLSGWAMGPDVVAVWEDPMFGICACDSTGSNGGAPQLAFVVNSGYWSFQEGTVTLQPVFGGSYCFFASGTDVPSSVAPSHYFDGFSLVVDPSTSSGTNPSRDHPAFRPNPTIDNLWIDLTESPLSITAIDASGRTHDLKNFTHRDRTLEVDVNALPTGICLLRITTASGTHAVRFVKA